MLGTGTATVGGGRPPTMESRMPDTLMFPQTAIAGNAEDGILAAALVREVAAGRHPRVTLDRPLPPAARSAAEILADSLDELDRDLARLRRRHSAPTSAGGRIRLAVAEAELLGGYVRDVAKTSGGTAWQGPGSRRPASGASRSVWPTSASSCACTGRQRAGTNSMSSRRRRPIRSDTVHPGQMRGSGDARGHRQQDSLLGTDHGGEIPRREVEAGGHPPVGTDR